MSLEFEVSVGIARKHDEDHVSRVLLRLGPDEVVMLHPPTARMLATQLVIAADHIDEYHKVNHEE